MPRVLGIDPGTLSIDFAVLEDGRTTRFATLPSAEVSRAPGSLLAVLKDLGSFDLIAAPSGYGLPLVRGDELDERLLRLAFLAQPGMEAGLMGLRRAVSELRDSGRPMVVLPGVIQLPTVPAHRKANRIDMGTADKVCAAAYAIADHTARTGLAPEAVSLVVAELGGAFTAVIAVANGAIVDGLGGTSGPLGFRAVGALDGEAAALAGEIPKEALFTGGAAWIAGDPALAPDDWRARAATDPRARTAWLAYVEGVAKAVAAMRVSAPSAREVVLSGRLARVPALCRDVADAVAALRPEISVRAPAALPPSVAKEAAVGAGLLADGLCGGAAAGLVRAMRILEAAGSILDHLHWPPAREGAARFEKLLS